MGGIEPVRIPGGELGAKLVLSRKLNEPIMIDGARCGTVVLFAHQAPRRNLAPLSAPLNVKVPSPAPSVVSNPTDLKLGRTGADGSRAESPRH
ncbi:hypothetical protein SAMN05444166_6721 [Singulisphaera sp. GP187]|nr:hypothetical protein SAMN05444166_6721 [Singulisphaera sp. GP187]